VDLLIQQAGTGIPGMCKYRAVRQVKMSVDEGCRDVVDIDLPFCDRVNYGDIIPVISLYCSCVTVFPFAFMLI